MWQHKDGKMKHFKILYIFFFFLFPVLPPLGLAQGSAGADAGIESRFIVDMPNAGVLPRGSFAINSLIYPGGGLMAEITAAPFTNFTMGIAFSGANIIGRGDVVWQDIPGVSLKFRFLNESRYWPAFALGVMTQGRGEYDKDAERFATLSPGVYLAFSKNYKWPLGTVAFHGGICYSFEPASGDRKPNFFIGLEHSVGGFASLNFEFNPNTDDKDRAITENQGLLNISFRLAATRGLTFEIQARDILENKIEGRGFTRFLGIEYVADF